MRSSDTKPRSHVHLDATRFSGNHGAFWRQPTSSHSEVIAINGELNLQALSRWLSTETINRLKLVYPYYMQGQMFVEWQRRWRAFPSDVLNKLWFSVVDDRTPEKPALDFLLDGDSPLKIEIYRIDIDKPLNAGWKILSKLKHDRPYKYSYLMHCDL